jgi:crotonobetainyl-CoA:carnitine CoA-transferase CaiB-like acyl-CoA transferase
MNATENATRIFNDKANTELSKVLDTMGIDRAAGPGSVRFTGTEPNYDSPHQITMGGAVAVAANASAVAALWRHATGRPQDIEIDLTQAAAAVYPTFFQKQNGFPIPELTLQRELKTAFYETADGRWFFPTGSYPHLRNGVLDVLECPNNSAAIAKAVSKWKGLDLEEVFAEKKLTGAMARTTEEWRAHPQGQALAAMPLIDIEKIGDSEPMPRTGAKRPLAGLRVVDMAHVIAGPVVTRTLAEQGAEVIRLSSPFQPEAMHHIFETGFGKRNAFLELKTAEGVETLRRLCKDADVFVDSWRPGSLAAAGFSPQELAKLRPGIIYVSVSAFGLTGPWSHKGGFEQLGQTVSGIAHTEGGDGMPKLVPTRLLNDYITAYLGAAGATAALLRRAQEGGSYHVRVSLTRISMWVQSMGFRSEADRRSREIIKPPLLNPVLERRESPLGVIEHLGPVAQYSETKGHWDLTPSLLGAQLPQWQGRR